MTNARTIFTLISFIIIIIGLLFIFYNFSLFFLDVDEFCVLNPKEKNEIRKK